MSLNINDNGTWKESVPYINDSGTWKEPDSVYVNDSGTWKEVYTAQADEYYDSFENWPNGTTDDVPENWTLSELSVSSERSTSYIEEGDYSWYFESAADELQEAYIDKDVTGLGTLSLCLYVESAGSGGVYISDTDGSNEDLLIDFSDLEDETRYTYDPNINQYDPRTADISSYDDEKRIYVRNDGTGSFFNSNGIYYFGLLELLE